MLSGHKAFFSASSRCRIGRRFHPMQFPASLTSHLARGSSLAPRLLLGPSVAVAAKDLAAAGWSSAWTVRITCSHLGKVCPIRSLLSFQDKGKLDISTPMADLRLNVDMSNALESRRQTSSSVLHSKGAAPNELLTKSSFAGDWQGEPLNGVGLDPPIKTAGANSDARRLSFGL